MSENASGILGKNCVDIVTSIEKKKFFVRLISVMKTQVRHLKSS